MGKKTTRNWFIPGWIHQHRRKRAKVAELRRLHGDNCWRCNRPMRFGGLPNVGKAATIVHLLALSRGGAWDLDNLRLCHVGCNRHLADHTPEQKERMRINRPNVDLPQAPA